MKNYLISVLIAVFVTLLWSSSWLLIKWGLEDIPPLFFSGLRYFIASFILLSVILSRDHHRREIRNITRHQWRSIIIYGLIFVSITQGTQFISLVYLPAITVSLILNFTIVTVIILNFFFSDEIPSKFQFIMIIMLLFGVILYFQDKIFISMNLEIFFGLIIAFTSMFTNSVSSILGRNLNKSKEISPLILTGLSMSFGSILLILVAFLIERPPNLEWISVIYILWLSIFNTALAFTLWNKAMQILRSIDITIINSLMLPQIVLLAFLFLEEIPNLLEWFSMTVIFLSIFFIQVNQAKYQEINLDKS